MFGREEHRVTHFRADYATHADFCEMLESETKSLYLLAFLMTANHKDAERCFVSTVDMALDERPVFKRWAERWVKRSLIKNAIKIASLASGQVTSKRDSWSVRPNGMPGAGGIDAVTRLAPLERFIFVMSILERYSDWECSLLLGCGVKKVVQIRLRALRRLPGPDALLRGFEGIVSGSLQATSVSAVIPRQEMLLRGNQEAGRAI